MKATLFLTLATMANAAPRIEQISPATGRIDGSPVAFDIDNDGDLDIAYLCNGQVGNGASASSAWLENLGDRKFSAPRALGHNFFTNNRSSIAETLIRPAHSDTSTLLHLTASISSQSIELHAKAVGSSSWKIIHRFEIDESVSFLKVPRPGQQLLFSKHASSDSVTVWQAYPDAIIKKGQLTLPPAAGNGNNTPSNFQSVDLDQDGNADLP